MLDRVLIANRGEIAVRVIRACNELGIETVALYSDADMNALHIVLADRAHRLPGNTSAETYLQQEKVIEIAQDAGCDGIHPGYGFLSENAEFASKVEDAGLKFVGPKSDVIAALGNKIVAKETADKAGVPTVPGIEGIKDPDEALERAQEEVGLPLMIKAAAGGGGRGMRVVRDWDDFTRSFNSAQSEAEAAFGSGELFIERFVEDPKHIEVQIIGDEHGNVVHLGERECSVQRRHQKLIEEAPSSVLTPEEREEIGSKAVALAEEAGYWNAGTVEFLFDSDRNFYFMEVNTRLQVEHPVTELITGTDIVQEQLRVASGEELSWSQEDIEFEGHAIEARINVEDPFADFAPDFGKLDRFIPPLGERVRIDTAAYEGYEVPRYYDSLVAKLITWGDDRDHAIKTMRRALNQFILTGSRTTIPFHQYVFSHEEFTDGWFSTNFVDEHFDPHKLKELLESDTEEDTRKKVAACTALAHYIERSKVLAPDRARMGSENWERINRYEDSNYES